MVDVAILGAGPAGMTAAMYLARGGMQAVVLERLYAGGQMANTDKIDNYPGFPAGVDGPDLSMQMEAQARALGAQIRYDEVRSLDLHGPIKRIGTSKDPVEARAVIIALGASPRKMDVPGEERLRAAGISYCATCDGAFFKGKRVAVVGGGDTAVHDALYLAGLCSEVLLIHRRDELRANHRDAQHALSLPNVKPIWHATVKEVLGDTSVKGLSLDVQGNAREEAVDAVFVAIGMIPATALLTGGPLLNESGYIVAGEDTRTSLPMVYAAGDIRQKPFLQIVTAISDGAVAAYAAQYDLAVL